MTKKIEDKEFIRCFFESESHRDMARKLGITEQSVGQRVKRLRKRLGEDLIPVKPRKRMVYTPEYIEELKQFAKQCKKEKEEKE